MSDAQPPTKLSFSLNKPANSARPGPPSGFSIGIKPASTSSPSSSAKPGPSSTSKQRSNVVSKPSAFSFDDDDEEPSALPAGPSGSSTGPPNRSAPTSNKALIAQNTKTSRAARKVQEEAMKVDQSVFEYDEVWDGMKAAQRSVEKAKEQEAAERKPKYVDAFLQAATTRRLDRLRAEDKMLQYERDKEGEEFADKEKFVTGAYKKQMEEVRKAEEDERLKEERDKKSRTGPGMTTFYRNMLDAEEEKHAAAVAAAKSSTAAGPSLVIRRPPAEASTPQYDPEPESDAYLRREAALQAAAATSAPVKETLPATNVITDEKVEINDEGAVVDHRVLLKAGLNITKKPIAPLPSLKDKASSSAQVPYKSRAVGASASHAERAARERKRLADLMAEEEARKARLAREKEEAEEELARKRRAGGADKEEGEAKRRAARERFEERKRRKLEEAKQGGPPKEDE